MKTIIFILLALGLIYAGAVQAQVGSSISADGTPPNVNAMLDVKSPSTGDGKGILIPRVSLVQRTTSSAALAGGLLDNSGNLRGGAAQGLIVYQTDGVQGLYFNTSQIAAPTWAYLGDVTGLLASNVWAAAASTTNYLPRTGGTMSGALNMGAQIVTNVAHIDFYTAGVSVGRGANGTNFGAAMGNQANGSITGVAVGAQANGSDNGAAVGNQANGSSGGAAVGYQANGFSGGAALGYWANGTNFGAALGSMANGIDFGAAMGNTANGSSYGAAVGYGAKGSSFGVALGYLANGTNYGAAVGDQAYGYNHGVAMGFADGYNYGTAVGYGADGSSYGVAVGCQANGARTNVAIGFRANAGNGTNQIAIGNNVTNDLPNTARIRGKLYLDGPSGGVYTNVGGFGSSDWGLKAFTIDHPLDSENKVLRHFCMEGPQVWNVYAGNAQLVNGQAVVELPEYYAVLNLVGSEIYSLTPIGGRADTWVQAEVRNNRFLIQGEKDIKVSWTIKVLRNDPGCLEDLRRRPVEQLKSELR